MEKEIKVFQSYGSIVTVMVHSDEKVKSVEISSERATKVAININRKKYLVRPFLGGNLGYVASY